MSSVSRRTLLTSGLTAAAWALAPQALAAAGARDRRLIVVVLRGAADGLALAPPVGDPAFAELRPEALADAVKGRRLDGLFALHPDLSVLGELFARRELIVVHAAASPYRERSHFDGQQVLESGGALPRQLDTGWLNRALTAIPTGPRPTSVRPIGVGRTAPLILTGAAPVTTWAPPSLQGAGADIYEQLSKLYASTDPEFAAALDGASALRGAAGGSAKGLTRADRLIAEAQQVARLAAGPEGPRVLALTIDAWDTHEQAFAKMATPVAVLDGVVGAFRDALGPLWRDTCILAVTEFGRTARLNGTRGTDHGTASVAFVAGGGVSGGRVLADWPGVAGPQLHEGRDLRPTLDLRGLAKGLLMEAFDLHRSRLDRDVFPGSADVPALVGLLT